MAETTQERLIRQGKIEAGKKAMKEKAEKLRPRLYVVDDDETASQYERDKAEFYEDDTGYGPSDRQQGDQRPRFKPWTYDEWQNMPRRQWRIGSKQQPLQIDKGLWVTFGKYKGAKTYFSLDEAFCQAEGIGFLGHPTMQGNVAYLLAEGGVESARERIQALCAKYNKSEEDVMSSGRFNLITSAVNFTKPLAAGGLDELLKSLDGINPATVYLDTWARMLAASGGHDSDPQVVGQAILGCDRLRRELDCAVTLLAHVGHNEQDRPKGMIDLQGAIDGATFCEKIGEGGEAEFHFKAVFQRHTLDGYELVGSLKAFGPDVALVAKAASAVNLGKLMADYRPAYEKLLELFKLNVADDGGPGSVPVEAWRNAVDPAAMWPGVANNGRDKWAKCKEAVEKAGLISILKDQVYLAL
jgi:hypothetical protein